MVLDVGQGDAILVETGRGGRVLIDGGPDPDRLLVELDRHIPPWDRRLDLVILTHPHEDHVAGLPLVVERYAVGRALDTGARGEGPGFAAWTAVLARRGVPTGRLLAGSAVGLDGVSLRAVWPDSTAVPTEPTAPASRPSLLSDEPAPDSKPSGGLIRLGLLDDLPDRKRGSRR